MVLFVVCTCQVYEGLVGLLLSCFCMLKFNSDIIVLVLFGIT